MLPVFDFTREMTLLAVAARMLTAMACGGVIGIERELKRRPAGFRTHILICVGASITVLTNLFLYQVMHLYTDVSRMGAQVITGISFIGAGTIIVTKRRRVKGLTTAAGLWAVGIIGLVCGAGYLEMALFASAMVLFAELVLSRLEYRFVRHIKDTNLYVEYESADDIQEIRLRPGGGRSGDLAYPGRGREDALLRDPRDAGRERGSRQERDPRRGRAGGRGEHRGNVTADGMLRCGSAGRRSRTVCCPASSGRDKKPGRASKNRFQRTENHAIIQTEGRERVKSAPPRRPSEENEK